MSRTIEVVPHDPAWDALFQAERDALRQAFEGEALAIHHIGSTSIPGIKAKPVIDILVEVRDIDRVEDHDEAMTALGYEPKGELGIPGRRFYIKGGEEHRSHHVHVFECGHPEIARHRDFCAYLRAHPEMAARYSALKEDLAREFKQDLDRYTEGKTGLIREIDRKARLWAAGKGR